MRRLIIGCGYLGRRIARAWQNAGDEIHALTRSPRHAEAFEAEGLTPIVGDVLHPQSLAGWPAVDTVLYAVGYDRTAGPSKRDVYVTGLRNVLEALPDRCGRLVYISSTSVYGQSGGEWVDESSPVHPTSEGGCICRDAEQLARSAYRGRDGISILRLSGIYGPGRLAARVNALQQQPIAADPEGWINLIHVDDAAAVAQTCADAPSPMETLLVTDDRPLRRQDYYAQLIEAIAAPAATFEPPVAAGLGKRCSNRRLRETPGMDLQYPTFTAGLPSAVAGTIDS